MIRAISLGFYLLAVVILSVRVTNACSSIGYPQFIEMNWDCVQDSSCGSDYCEIHYCGWGIPCVGAAAQCVETSCDGMTVSCGEVTEC